MVETITFGKLCYIPDGDCIFVHLGPSATYAASQSALLSK